MDFDDAVSQVIDEAEKIISPGTKIDIVTRIRRDFAKHGSCEHSLAEMVWEVLRKRLSLWTLEDKRGIWESLQEIGEVEEPFSDFPEDSNDMFLEVELMDLITEALSPPGASARNQTDHEE